MCFWHSYRHTVIISSKNFVQVDLKDQSGEISATFFGRAVDKYYSMLKPGQVMGRRDTWS